MYPTIRHYGGLPNPNSVIGSINGLMQGVYAYGGAQLFVEFMAEMKRPRDFIKAMWGAQVGSYDHAPRVLIHVLSSQSLFGRAGLLRIG